MTATLTDLAAQQISAAELEARRCELQAVLRSIAGMPQDVEESEMERERRPW